MISRLITSIPCIMIAITSLSACNGSSGATDALKGVSYILYRVGGDTQTNFSSYKINDHKLSINYKEFFEKVDIVQIDNCNYKISGSVSDNGNLKNIEYSADFSHMSLDKAFIRESSKPDISDHAKTDYVIPGVKLCTVKAKSSETIFPLYGCADEMVIYMSLTTWQDGNTRKEESKELHDKALLIQKYCKNNKL